MLYNKKGLFFRKITAKIVGNSQHKRKGDKCHTVQRAPSSHHHQEKSGNGGLPLLIAMTREKDLIVSASHTSRNDANEMSCVVGPPNKPVVSGLLAAKLRCDEWGLHNRGQAAAAPKKVSTVSSQATSTSISSPKRRRHPIQRPRLVNKVHHPSYKPPMVQRSASMKERREAMENASKYHNQYFSSSLYRIDEVDEKGLD